MKNDKKPIGYQALIERYKLRVIYYQPALQKKNKRYDLKTPLDQLLFALQKEELHLGILKAVFPFFSKKELEQVIEKNKTKALFRKLWYLYEFLTDQRLDIPDMKSARYVALLDKNKYYTSLPQKKRRYFILDNLLGTRNFCPMVRRTRKLKNFEKQDLQKKDLQKKALKLLKQTKSLLPQAPSYKKTEAQSQGQSQWQTRAELLEKERANKARHRRFIQLLKRADSVKNLTKQDILFIHKKAMGRNFEKEYRKHQNYLAYDNVDGTSTICRISPKPEDVEMLMQGLLDCYARMKESSVHPVVIAAVISFGFSIIHPFGDGNGRVQLFLLYYLLLHSRLRQVAKAFVRNLIAFFYLPGFHTAIGSFDKALLRLVRIKMHKNETLTVFGKTQDLYSYIDFSPLCEFLAAAIQDCLYTKKMKN